MSGIKNFLAQLREIETLESELSSIANEALLAPITSNLIGRLVDHYWRLKALDDRLAKGFRSALVAELYNQPYPEDSNEPDPLFDALDIPASNISKSRNQIVSEFETDMNIGTMDS